MTEFTKPDSEAENFPPNPEVYGVVDMDFSKWLSGFCERNNCDLVSTDGNGTYNFQLRR